jgi:lipopolysaccharide/colanic/teichoic acid biosynthesis glycosyltransferase
MPHPTTYASKRGWDILIATVTLVLLSPLFLLIAILIKLDSRGAVFFRHPRVGINGRNFMMWKFRTMVSNADRVGPGLTAVNDPRITRLGKWLRRLSLDELPQLVNVLTGEMSLVGPRPEIPEIVSTYSSEQKRALAVRPGITGLSQINGRDDLPMKEKLDYEIQYVERCSPTLDLRIILRTLPALINARGNRY